MAQINYIMDIVHQKIHKEVSRSLSLSKVLVEIIAWLQEDSLVVLEEIVLSWDSEGQGFKDLHTFNLAMVTKQYQWILLYLDSISLNL